MANYETFATTADTGIRFRGRDFSELYTHAVRGLNLLLFGTNPRPPAIGGEILPFRFRGDGPETVLVNLLSEALYQAYQRRKRVAALAVRRAERGRLEANLLLVPCRRVPRLEVKSATYHNLHVAERRGALRAAIVFDV